ncbi:hypothetical protein HPB50_014029 [Hyalomma asiaticum]|uniref:Uncharacterized protein n=1 Tax=Hyalomma asiaticum TaxID=266040 RepID=A0ACB7T680_HYAAI|nr:hypothetical protein HPB50_014029 [Hyalomma asiaticum]
MAHRPRASESQRELVLAFMKQHPEVAQKAAELQHGLTVAYKRRLWQQLADTLNAERDEKLRLAWNRAIPRADKDLTTKSRVCSLHFYDQDILKTYVHVVNGETVAIPRGKWSDSENLPELAVLSIKATGQEPKTKTRKQWGLLPWKIVTEIWRSITGIDCINFKHYERLYDAEKGSHLKIVPKLTSSHVKPSKLEKMNVRLATQLFSRSVAIGLKFYREQGEPGFEDSEGTEQFTRLVNELFDVLNAKHPAAGIQKNSPKIKVIENFLTMLNTTEKNSIERNTKLFASQLTTASLRVTLMSVLDIITLLHDKDVRYVLTAKLNQDPLERVFGVMRSFGGDEDHPTIGHFCQIFRLLSLYTPLNMATKGNCSGDADPVLISVEESLSSKRLEVLQGKKEREDKLGQLIHKIVLEKLPEGDTNQHNYGRPTAIDAALHYLAGYVSSNVDEARHDAAAVTEAQRCTGGGRAPGFRERVLQVTGMSQVAGLPVVLPYQECFGALCSHGLVCGHDESTRLWHSRHSAPALFRRVMRCSGLFEESNSLRVVSVCGGVAAQERTAAAQERAAAAEEAMMGQLQAVTLHKGN